MLALCDAFINNTEVFDYKKWKLNGPPQDNLEKAFELAETKLGVPRLLDSQEIVAGQMDERSLILYISLFVSWKELNYI